MPARRIVVRLIKIGRAEHAYRAVRDQCALYLLLSSLRSNSITIRAAAVESLLNVLSFTRVDCEDIYDALIGAMNTESDANLFGEIEMVAGLYGDKLDLY